MQDESELESPQIIRSKEMVSRSKRRITGIDKPAAKAYPDKAKKAGKVADIALCLYGEPTLSLSQMRTALVRIPVKAGRHSGLKVGHLSGQNEPPVTMAVGSGAGLNKV